MKKFLGLTAIIMATAGYAFAGFAPAPEIDANSAVSAVALLSGGLLILKSRRAK